MHDQKRSNRTSTHTKTFAAFYISTEHLHSVWNQFCFYYSCGKMYISPGLLFKHRPFWKKTECCTMQVFSRVDRHVSWELVCSTACWTSRRIPVVLTSRKSPTRLFHRHQRPELSVQSRMDHTFILFTPKYDLTFWILRLKSSLIGPCNVF